MEAPNLVTVIAGLPKTGKTHLALTFPEPVKIYSFDVRGAEPIAKAKFEGKHIDVEKVMPPVLDTLHPKPYAMNLLDYIKAQYEDDTTKYKTIVFDTATVLWEIVRHAWVEKCGRQNLMPRDYGEPNSNMTWFLMQAAVLGVNLVSLNYIKEKYVDEKPTGEYEIDGFRRTKGLVDVVVSMRKETKAVGGGKRKAVFYGKIEDNRYDPDVDGEELTNPTYDDIITVLGVA